MGDLSQLVGGAPAHDAGPDSPTAFGRITRAPTAWGDPLTVVIGPLAGEGRYDVTAGHWVARALPAEGMHCLVIFDDRGDAWAIVEDTRPPAA